MRAAASKWASAGLAAAAFAAALCMPTAESLWIDEACTWSYASLPTLADWGRTLAADGRSEAQMPLAMFVAWAWGRVAGMSEWGLRSLNVLWVAGAALVLARMPRGAGGGRGLAVMLLAHPFVWFYANEARPYAMQIAAASGLAAGLHGVLSAATLPHPAAWALAGGAVVLAGSSMLGVVPLIPVAGLLAWRLWRGRLRVDRRGGAILCVAAVLLAGMGVYYAWTLTQGAGGAKFWRPGIGNLAFAAYELLGFQGLGPGRIEMREAAQEGAAALLAALRPYAVPLAALAAALGVVAVAAFTRLRVLTQDATVAAAAVVLVTSSLLMVALAQAAGFPFWGRHLAPLLPFLLIVVRSVCLPAKVPSRPRMPGRALLVPLLIALWAASSVSLRLAPRHRKEDYRAAAAAARACLDQGGTVWWAADGPCGRYYGLDVDSPRLPVIYRASIDQLNALSQPSMVVLTKPSIFDPNHVLVERLRNLGFRSSPGPQGFTMWTRGAGDDGARAAGGTVRALERIP